MKKLIFKQTATLLLILFTYFLHARDREMDTSIYDRIDKMTLQEKLGQLNLSSDIVDLKVITEVERRIDYIRKGLIGSSWGYERRKTAVNESKLGIPNNNRTFSPMADISQDPLWERVAEGAGDDPFLGSEITKAYLLDYQGTNLFEETMLLACIKHFALYGAPEAGSNL